MTPDPVDAALDVWLGNGWTQYCNPNAEDYRARMRRVLDAYDARKAKRIADIVLQEVLDLPDRNSPEDWPEACLVTGEELHGIVLAACETAALPEPEVEAAKEGK